MIYIILFVFACTTLIIGFTNHIVLKRVKYLVNREDDVINAIKEIKEIKEIKDDLIKILEKIEG